MNTIKTVKRQTKFKVFKAKIILILETCDGFKKKWTFGSDTCSIKWSPKYCNSQHGPVPWSHFRILNTVNPHQRSPPDPGSVDGQHNVLICNKI